MEFYGERPMVDLTYSDVFLVPRRSDVRSRLDVDLSPHDGTGATLPLVSANMNSVTGARSAAALARRGGLGVLPQDMPLQELDAAIRWVKDQPVPWDTPLVLTPDVRVAEAMRLLAPAAGYAIVVADEASGPLPIQAVRGIVEAAALGSAGGDVRLGDLVGARPVAIDAEDVTDFRHAFELIVDSAAETVCVLRHGMVVGTLSERSALRASLYTPAVDADGRLIVAAAIGVNGDVQEKARALVAAGVDVLVIDTAHGHQDAMLSALRAVSELHLTMPIVAGNVVTAEGVHDLVDAGATIVKVGVGPGAMCTTRMMTAVGRPQFSAVLEAAQAARLMGAHVWADGGVRYPRDVALALAAGASSVMIGSWFAGTVESPGALLVDADGRLYKESWGMASTKAVRARFGRLDAYERARKELFAEGISSSRIYLDPLRPGLDNLVDMIVSGVRSSFTYAGARTLTEFEQRARVGLQSASGYDEGKALPVGW